MAIPEGLRSTETSRKVCKLQKSLYGLKQSTRQWYSKMHEFLLELGFTSSKLDPCLYIQYSESGITIIALYVDSLLNAGNSLSEINLIKKELSK